MNRLDALGNHGLREAALFVRAQQRPVTSDDVAAALAIPRSAARRRLERLVEAGLLVVGFERRTGRTGPGAGRPAKTYAAAVETAPIEFPPRRYDELVGLLVDALPKGERSTRLAHVGASFGAKLAKAAGLRRAARMRTALDRLCHGLGTLGFQAALDSVSAEQAVIVSATCPLRPLVLADPAVRAIDQAMWRALVGAVADERFAPSVTCRTHDCGDRDAPCRVLVRFAARDQLRGSR